MSFIPDPDLVFLSSVSNEDLDIIFNLLVYDSEKKKRITQELLDNKLVKKYYPDHRQYIKSIIEEIQKFGANSIASILRGKIYDRKGVLYYEILNDVCDTMKIKYPKNGQTQEIESCLLEYIEKKFKDYINKLSIKERENLLKKININDNELNKYINDGFLQYFIKRSGTLPHKNGGASSVSLDDFIQNMPIFLGVGIMFSAIVVFGPAYRVTGPICITIACLRKKYCNKSSKSCESEEPFEPQVEQEKVDTSQKEPDLGVNSVSGELTEEDCYNFAYIDFRKYAQLANLAMPEDWSNPYKEYGQLEIYIRNTFNRILYEGKVAYSNNGNYAAINTGLLDFLYRPIYALFTLNRYQGRQKWYLKAFCVEGEDAGKELIREIRELPERADYFSGNYSKFFYDIRAGRPSVDFEHVVIENADRIPLSFFQRLPFSNAFKCKDCSNMREDERNEYKAELMAAFKGGERAALTAAKSCFDHALDEAFAHVIRNYRTVLPIYYPRSKSICLLLPLCLSGSSSHADVALVVERMESGRYQGHTILTLDMAYSDVRLIYRPDSDWLNLKEMRLTKTEGQSI